MATPDAGAQGQPSHLNWREGLPLLVSPRVVLRELRRSDAAALWQVARLPGVARYSWPAPPTVDAFEAFIAQAWRDRTDGKSASFALVLRDQTEPSGVFELRSLQPNFVRAELSVMIDPSLWDNGTSEDGIRLVCQFGFTTIGVHRIEVRSVFRHTQYNAALEKLGLKKEAILRAAFAHDGHFEDQFLWAIVKGLDPLAAAPAAAG